MIEKEELKRLKFRRQYVISPKELDCPFLNNTKKINNKFWLYTHIDLLYTEYTQNNVTLMLLGDIFDYETPGKSNIDILKDVIDTDFEHFVEKTKKYCGRFVFIYSVKDKIYLFTDATATRKIYYCKLDDDFWCASQSYLLASITGCKKTDNPSKSGFYGSGVHKYLNNSNIGNTTVYDEISQLMPNHYFSVHDHSVTRFYPNNKMECKPVVDIADICAKMIKGYVESIAYRYKIMLPVTAGKDSRTLLAGTKNVKNEVIYYINKEPHLNNKSNDIKIPKKLLGNLGLDFHILNPYVPIDKDFLKVYYENNEYASNSYLPHIYNYYVNFSDRVNLPGNFVASAYDMYLKNDKGISAKTLAKYNWVKKHHYSLDVYSKWLENCLPISREFNYNIWVLFYWEERLANWGTQVQLDKDIAQEDINPFNSRLLIEYFFSVKPIYIDRPRFQLFMNIMKILWPEVLDVPTNPSFIKNISKTLDSLGILDTMRYIRSTLFHWDKPV